MREGTTLPELSLPLSTTLIVSSALATRDFQDVHHDRDAALRRGAPDIFMNILTTTGLVQRYVTDWAGPAARVTGVSVRLGVPNFPHDTMRLSGRVTERDGDDVVVAIRGANSLGDHVTATVRLTLEDGGTPS